MIGTDIVDVKRIDQLITQHGERFLNKVFTNAEQKYCSGTQNASERYAGRFAAKEAVRKALQPFTDARYLPFLDIEILPDNSGVPVVTLNTDIEFTREIGSIFVSIAHERLYAIANVLVQ